MGSLQKIIALLLVLSPILNVYCLPIGPDIPLGNLLFLILILLFIFKRKPVLHKLPKGFLLFWAYIGVDFIFITINHFKITYLFPGGLTFCIWVVVFCFILNYIDINILKKYYKIVFLFCAFALFYQELCFFFVGSRPLFMLPFPISGGNKSSELADAMLNLDRSSAFFREPSHFAQFALPLLALELMSSSNKRIFMSKFAILIMFTLVILRSGMGLLGMSVLFILRFIGYIRIVDFKYKILTFFILVPLITTAVVKYSKTELGSAMMDRATNVGVNEDSESFDRTFRGYLLYGVLPTKNKLLGISEEELLPFINNSSLAVLFTMNGEKDTYMNGIQYVLVHYGLFGLILFLLVFFRLFKSNDYLARSMIILFLTLMLVGNMYASFVMLICTTVAYINKQQKYAIHCQ